MSDVIRLDRAHLNPRREWLHLEIAAAVETGDIVAWIDGIERLSHRERWHIAGMPQPDQITVPKAFFDALVQHHGHCWNDGSEVSIYGIPIVPVED